MPNPIGEGRERRGSDVVRPPLSVSIAARFRSSYRQTGGPTGSIEELIPGRERERDELDSGGERE